MRASSLNRIDRKGMRISIVHPPSKSAERVSQMVFQSALAFSLTTCGIAHPALGIREEDVSVPTVVERIEHHAEMVVVVEIGRITAHVARHPLRRIALPEPRAYVDRVFVIGHPDLGLVGRCRPFERLLLHEVPDRLGVPVDALVETTVEHDRLREPNGADGDMASLVARSHGRRHRFRRARNGRIPRALRGRRTHEARQERQQQNGKTAGPHGSRLSRPRDGGPDIRRHRIAVTVRVDPNPALRRLTQIAVPNAAQECQILLVSVTIGSLPSRRGLRRDVEQYRQIRLREVLLHREQPGRIETLRLSVGDARRQVPVAHDHGALRRRVDDLLFPLVAIGHVQELHHIRPVVPLPAQRTTDLAADDRVVVRK